MLIAHTRVDQYNTSFAVASSALPTMPNFAQPNSPTDFAHVKVLIARPPSAPGRVAASTLSSIFCRSCSSHAARYTVFLLGIQRVELCVVNPAVLCAARSIQVSVRAKQQ
jgi:hypothetical protein